MKKVLSLLVAFALMLSVCIMGLGTTASALETSPESDFIAFDGVIEEYIGPGGQVVIPSTIDGVAVTEIAANAFAHNTDVEEVYIPEGVEKIGNRAFFNCSNIYKLELPYTLYEVGSEAFYAMALNEVTIPAQWEQVGYGAFNGNQGLSDIKFSYGVREIHSTAFCASIPGTIVFPETMELIAAYAFNYVRTNARIEFIICNPNLDLGRKISEKGLWKEMMQGQWSDDITRPWNSSTAHDQVFIHTVPEGSAIGKFIEENESKLLDKANDNGACNNDYRVQYKPQSYFDALTENQPGYGICATRTDLTFTQAPVTPAPDTQTPDTQAPDTQAPDTQAPDTQTPDTQAPDTQAPDTQAPDTQAPDTQAPDTQAPDTQVPDTQAPDTQAPDTQTPNTNQPGGTTTTIIEQGGSGDDNLGLILGIAGGIFLLVLIGVAVFAILMLKPKKAAAPAIVAEAAPAAPVEEAEEVAEAEETEAEDAE